VAAGPAERRVPGRLRLVKMRHGDICSRWEEQAQGVESTTSVQ
jgi:hypothetical protein